MFNQVFTQTIKKLSFKTIEGLTKAEAEKYARQQVETDAYKQCTIDEVYVNGKLVLTNVHPK